MIYTHKSMHTYVHSCLTNARSCYFEIPMHTRASLRYDVVYMSIARWIGEDALVVAQSQELKNKIDRLIKASGDMPHETSRYQSVYYFAYTLDAYAVAAELATQVGVDVWRYENKAGATLATCIQYIVKHVGNAFEDWPHPTDPKPGAFKEHYLERPFRLAAKRGLLDSNNLLGLARFVQPASSDDFLIRESPDNYAIAFSFGPMAGVDGTGQKAMELQCAMALNAAASRAKTNVDTFVIFPKGYTPPAAIQELLDHHRVHIRHTNMHKLWNASGSIEVMRYTSEVQRTMMLRFETFCTPHRSRVLYLDGDAFLNRADPEMWSMHADEKCVFSGGATSPAAGSAFLITPSFKICESVRRTMQGKF